MMLKDRAKQVLSPVLSRFHELELSHGKGCYLYDTQNNAYLDLGSGIAVTATGHCHPEVVNAIQTQANTLIHPCIAVGNTESVVNCAETLTRIAGSDYQVFFDQSGSAAVEAALKCAKFVTGKHKIIAFKGGFHGRSMGSLSVTTSKASYQEGIGPLVPGAQFFDYPYCYRCPWNAERETCETKPCTEALLNSVLFQDDVAAVIIEPILGEAGYIPAPIKFLKALQKRCQETGILLILDEIQTGIGRAGSWFAYEKAGLSPDLIVTAKGLGSGMPISACLGKKHIMENWTKGSHGGTYGANPVTCAATNATLSVVKKHLPNITKLSELTQTLLTERLKNHPYIGDIRVEGLLIAIECVKDKKSKEPYPVMTGKLLKKALEKNLIILMSGLYSNVIRLAPPLIITENELKTGLNTLCEVIHDYH